MATVNMKARHWSLLYQSFGRCGYSNSGGAGRDHSNTSAINIWKHQASVR
jgi:hypothetical protein